MVRFEEVSLSYDSGPAVLTDISFELDPGSFHFVVGDSGAGKSSLLRLIYLAAAPSSGRILLFGRDIAQLTRDERALLRRRIGMVFQDFRLLDHLTALENVALPLRIAGHGGAEVERHVAELLAWVGLSEQLHVYPPTLSGG
ncbi:MAG TPA: ATP-binding cassette domain-containing protein, partial [Kiloniellales bacterium]|nr:ATP-binding cassette domain-containing protein [Kiloniellales bacterium]